MYKIVRGKFGLYFYDTKEKKPIPLKDVLKILNQYSKLGIPIKNEAKPNIEEDFEDNFSQAEADQRERDEILTQNPEDYF